MPIAVGEKIPSVTLFEIGAEGPAAVSSDDVFAGKKVALFGVPGAYTPTCHQKHMPSYIGQMDALKAKGVDDVVCVSVNDPFVMKEWAGHTGADTAGIRVLGDSRSELAKGMDILLDGSAIGLVDRLLRFSAYVEDGEVKAINIEGSPGEMDATSAEKLLEQI
ncbi:MAG: peroxiredoxin [Pseudomonadota bacterium]